MLVNTLAFCVAPADTSYDCVETQPSTSGPPPSLAADPTKLLHIKWKTTSRVSFGGSLPNLILVLSICKRPTDQGHTERTQIQPIVCELILSSHARTQIRS
jgi:hypothetical protein